MANADNKIYFSSVINEIFHTENYKGKKNQSVYPHRINKLYNGISGRGNKVMKTPENAAEKAFLTSA